MILPLHDTVRTTLLETVRQLYGLDQASLPPVAIETPPNRAMGDLAVALAFELARRLRKAPRIIAQEIAAALIAPDGVLRVVAAPNGYINFFLDRLRFLADQLAPASRVAPPPVAGKAIVEHTAINPNKAAHIGHLRNSTLGDTLVRLLRFRNIPVEVQNYIDDTGVQVADVVVGFRELENRSVGDVTKLADSTRFDYYCWDLYARVTEWYEQDKERLKVRARTLHDIEHGGNENAELGALVADRIVRAHLKTLGRMNVEYDLLTWEGDILRLHFWATAFELLKQNGAVYFQKEGRLAGCWVMQIDEEPGRGAEEAEDAETRGDAEAEAAAESEAEQREKVIVRSDGTVTYVGKDIAYQFWKLGVLGKDFYYRVFEERGERKPPLWATSSTPGQDDERRPHFGGASMTFNVIDTRQSYLQKLLKQALAAMGYVKEAANSTHFSYEMVALSHATARELGYQPEDTGKPFVDVSGRKGLGVKADDLLDRLFEKALGEVEKRNPEQPAAEREETARIIATSAVRYFLLKYSLSKMIIFDIGEALSFEGETGPYIQYAVVRAQNIFAKLKDREGTSEQDVVTALPSLPPDALTTGDEADALWGLALEASRLDEVVEQAVRTLEPATLAKYTFGLAQAFNGFYHRYPILNEERSDLKRWRAAVVALVRRQLTAALNLMGCQVPSRM